MAKHMSIRLAWHGNGWNGRICNDPASNTYCVGRYSYPGESIFENRNLEWEKENAGTLCGVCSNEIAPCCLSINAFSSEHIKGYVDVPKWMEGKAEGVSTDIPPYTAFTWGYESMYSDDVLASAEDGRKYNNDVRFANAREYFDSFEASKSLLFYYANYSNPFSDDEAQKYVIVGISRLKQIGKYIYYENTTEEIKKNYANGIVWQKPVTSCYPDQGFCIPYDKYIDNEEVLNRIAFIPENTRAFKYGSRDITDDEAIYYILRFIEIVDILIELNDTTENWALRKEWLNSLLAELWRSRGAYPGIPAILELVGLNDLIQNYMNMVGKNTYMEFYKELKSLLNGDRNSLSNCEISSQKIRSAQRSFALLGESEQEFLINIAPRFDFSITQLKNVVSESRANNGIQSSMDEIVLNPYIICEEYVPNDLDDYISVYKLDNGIIPSPEYGLTNICEKDSPERLRAFIVSVLKSIAAHSFVAGTILLERINKKLAVMPEWKSSEYVLRNFTIKVDADVLSKALYIRKNENSDIYIYLEQIYEDERLVESTIRELAERTNISIRIPISTEKFYEKLRTNGKLLELAPEEYEKALQSQAKICYDLFLKPISVISGAAGTGKTTILKSIIENINRVHGEGTPILIMTPTGKATERIKKQTGKPSTTIHSFLAKQGWIGENFILKQTGGARDNSCDTIIIDECSMIDLTLFATLIRSINWNSVKRLILVGDPNQLPPIGRGKVFSDIIKWLSTEYPENIGVLHENIRQLANRVEGNGNGILDLAEIFIQEKQKNCETLDMEKEAIISKIQFGGDIEQDLSVYYWNSHEQLEQTLKKVIISDMEKDTSKECEEGKEYLLWDAACKNGENNRSATYQQIISPYRGEYHGTQNINLFIQKLVNGAMFKKSLLDGIAIGDKVIQYRNRPKSDPAYAYDLKSRKTIKKEIYNGEIGFVRPHGLDFKDNAWAWKRIKRFQVLFAGDERSNFWYNYGDQLWKDSNNRYIPEQKPLDNLELAYAISVHKSQGSEFNRIYLIIPKKQSHLMSMELIYTAITRAQRHLTIFVEDNAATLLTLSRLEKSGVRRINSSIFEFNPIPEDFLNFSSWFEEGKKISTLTEYLVRSKSEMNIANILYSNSIGFQYEEPLFAEDGSMYLPDFTIDWRGKTYYWEHVGLLNSPQYAAHWEKKKSWYEKFFPGKLIVTYESNMQSSDIKDIFRDYFGLMI